MPAGSDHENELRILRERIYGAGGRPTSTDIARLRELEDIGAGADAAVDSEPTRTGADAPVDEQPAVDSEPDGKEAEAPAPRRSRWRGIVAASVVALAVGGAAFVVGVVVATPSAPDDFPELLLPQTEEDVIAAGPDDPVADSVDLTSTRFIARVDGYDVFLARPAGLPGVCVFVRVAGSDALSGAGCSENPVGRGSVGFSGVGGLTVFVGDIDRPPAGQPVQLSESVVAYVS